MISRIFVYMTGAFDADMLLGISCRLKGQVSLGFFGGTEMDILEFAMENEKLSEESYRKLARRAKVTGLKNIFSMLADEESKHVQVIEEMIHDVSPILMQTTLLARAKEVFAKIRESSEEFDFDADELAAYSQARDVEAKSRDFYEEKAGEVDNPLGREIFEKLAAEEQKHFLLLDNICDFVSEPVCFLENAEFVHLEDYPV